MGSRKLTPVTPALARLSGLATYRVVTRVPPAREGLAVLGRRVYRPLLRRDCPFQSFRRGARAEGLSTRHPFGPYWTGLRPADRAVGGVSG